MRTAAACIGIALVAACRQRVDVEPPVGRRASAGAALAAGVHLVPGELARYTLQVRDVVIGGCELRSGAVEDRDGRAVARISSVIESAGVAELVVRLRDEVSTVVDLAIGRPIETRGSFTTLLTGGRDPDAEVDAPWLADDHNGHSLLFALRGWDAVDGTRAVTRLVARGRAHRVDLHLAGREILLTALAPLPVVKIEGVIADASSRGEPFAFVLWVADDWTRAILRLDTDTDFGQIASARIVEYALPR
jgi:hypothetical protein